MKSKIYRINLILIILIFLGFCSFLFVCDGLAPDDSDLKLTIEYAPVEKNGYLILLMTEDKVRLRGETETIKKILEQQPFDAVQARSLLEIYNKELHEFFIAIDYPYFGHSVNQLKINKVPLNLERLAQIQAKLDLHNGQPEKAAKVGVYLIKLGHRFEHCHGLVIDCFAGMGMKKNGMKIIREAFDSGLSRYQANLIRQRIVPYQDSKEGLIEAFRLEYTVWSSLLNVPRKFCEEWDADPENENIKLTKIKKLVTLLPFLYKPNKTRQLYAEKTRFIINIANGNQLETPVTFWKPNLFSNNMIGEILMPVLIPSPMILSKQQEIEEDLKDLINALEYYHKAGNWK